MKVLFLTIGSSRDVYITSLHVCLFLIFGMIWCQKKESKREHNWMETRVFLCEEATNRRGLASIVAFTSNSFWKRIWNNISLWERECYFSFIFHKEIIFLYVYIRWNRDWGSFAWLYRHFITILHASCKAKRSKTISL